MNNTANPLIETHLTEENEQAGGLAALVFVVILLFIGWYIYGAMVADTNSATNRSQLYVSSDSELRDELKEDSLEQIETDLETFSPDTLPVDDSVIDQSLNNSQEV